MHQGDWKCSGCGGAITELPFEPRDTSNLKCKNCFSKQSDGGTRQTAAGEKKMYPGAWECSGCNKAITELPFEPRGRVDNLKCRECFKRNI